MRDKSKDKDFEGKPYYGFTNIKRLSNLDIMMGCFAVMAIGAVFHYFAIRYVNSRAKRDGGGEGGDHLKSFLAVLNLVQCAFVTLDGTCQATAR